MEYVLDVEVAKKCKSLLIADWVLVKDGLWLNIWKRANPVTFEKACEIEGL